MTQAPAPFMERHLALAVIITLVLLVLVGAALGHVIGTLGVSVLDALLPQVDPSR